MALSGRVARPLLASIFVVGGWDALWNPAGKDKNTVGVGEPLTEEAGPEDLDAEMLVRVNGAVQIGAGVLLAIGKFRRLAALALIGSIIPTTYAGHRFWEESDPTTRSEQKMQFLKNLGLLGGLVLAAFDTEGEPSLAWRAKRQARQLESAVAAGRQTGHRKALRARKSLAPRAVHASKAGKQAVRRGRGAGRHAGQRLAAAGLDLAEWAAPDPEVVSHAHEVVADAVKGSAETATHAVQQAASFVSDAARQAPHPKVDAIVPNLASGAERTTEVLSKLREHLSAD